MFKNFCRCNATVSDLYDGKSKNKIAVTFFFPNSHGCNFNLHNINLDDNFDKDAPDTIILIKLLVWHV